MKNLIMKIKNNFIFDINIYVLLIIISFFISFIAVNIHHAYEDYEILTIYSNYNFTTLEKETIKENIDDSILELEVYYDKDLDSTRMSTTGFMLSDIFILKKEVMEQVVNNSNIFLDLSNKEELSEYYDDSLNKYALKIKEEANFYLTFNATEEYYILINNTSTNIGKYGEEKEHQEVFSFIKYLIAEE